MKADSFNIGDLVKGRNPTYSKDFGFIVRIEEGMGLNYIVQWFTYESPLGYQAFELVKVS